MKEDTELRFNYIVLKGLGSDDLTKGKGCSEA